MYGIMGCEQGMQPIPEGERVCMCLYVVDWRYFNAHDILAYITILYYTLFDA